MPAPQVALRSVTAFGRVDPVKFGVWHPFAAAADAAPGLPGLLQTRAEDAIAYPRGKSAMVLYAGSRPDETLRDYVPAAGGPLLRRAKAHGARWVRFGETATPELELERLMTQFEERFGTLPVGNAAAADEEAVPNPDKGESTPNG